MATPSTLNAPARKSRQPSSNPFASGLPDPRPVTDYTADYSVVGGNSRVTIKLEQPCVVRKPAWMFINCADGSAVKPDKVTVVDNTQFYFDFAGVIDGMVAFVDVPYQDTQVQNYQGGFVRSGARWFRKPVSL